MFERTFKNIDDVQWKEAGCATELDYTEQTSWILFLRYLDDLVKGHLRLLNDSTKEVCSSILRSAGFACLLTRFGGISSVEKPLNDSLFSRCRAFANCGLRSDLFRISIFFPA